MVQFHALALLHALRAKDRLAVSKLVSSMTRSKVFHPMAQMMLVRYVAQVGTQLHSGLYHISCKAYPSLLHTKNLQEIQMSFSYMLVDDNIERGLC